jgi:hypothetical protein
MKLIGFSISEDFVALECGPDRFDLHNNFDFQGLSYNPAQRTLELRWRRGLGEWIKATEPSDLCMSFAGVYFFKAQERDPALPYTEDSCLDSLGFMWDDLAAEMQAFTSNQPGDGCTHLTANFMSGFSVKVGAESVILQVAGGA